MTESENFLRPGPFFPYRHEIIRRLKGKIKTGDIFYRHTDVYFIGIPFSNLVRFFTESKFSHASVALVENDEIYLAEVNDQGTLKMRLIDWIDYCYGDEIAIYRFKNSGPHIKNLEIAIRNFLEEDPDYDFTFAEYSKYYCTESVAAIYKKIGIELMEPVLIKDASPWWFYYLIFYPINKLVKLLTGKGLPTDKKLYFVGNEEKGLMASDKTEFFYKFVLPK